MSVSPTQRSLKNLRDRGYLPCVAEYYHAYARRRKDLYNFIDIVALHPEESGVLGIQTTTGAHLMERVKKAEGLPAYWLWLSCKNDVEFHGWRKIKNRWQPKIIRVSYKDLLT